MLHTKMARTYRQIPPNRYYRHPTTFNSLKNRGIYKEDLAELGLVLQSRVKTRYIPSAREDLLVSSHREYYPYRRWHRWLLAELKNLHLSPKELLARTNSSWVEWYAVYKRTKNNARR